MSMATDLKVSGYLQALADLIDTRLENLTGERVGFCLLAFNTVENSRASYISNCHREEVIKAMKGLLDYWDQGGPDIPTHNYQS